MPHMANEIAVSGNSFTTPFSYTAVKEAFIDNGTNFIIYQKIIFNNERNRNNRNQGFA